jgi:hypothetical protein
MGVGWTKADIELLAACLEARYFIVTDDETEEVLIRSWVRFDGLIKQPRMAVSFANSYAAVASNDIRGVIVHEANKLRDIEPDALGWSKPQVSALLGLAQIDPKARATPEDPFGPGFTHTFGDRFTPSLGETQSKVSPAVSVAVSVAPTPAPAPAPLLLSPTHSDDAVPEPVVDKPARKRAAQLSDDWEPRNTEVELAKSRLIDLEEEAAKFRNYYRGTGKPMKDWDATFNNWLRNVRGAQKPATAPNPNSWMRRRPQGDTA